MGNDERKRTDPGDMFRDGVRAATGILGAFKDAIEQTFNDLSERGDISPDRARDAARDAMKRAQESVDDMRGRLDFVARREFDELQSEVAELRTQLERHTTAGVHHTHASAATAGGASGGAGAPGSGGTGTGSAGSSTGDGSPGL